MRVPPWLEKRAPAVHKFLTRKDKPWPVVREIVLASLALLTVLVLLFGLTAQPVIGGYPVVVVTTGSMMHCTNGNPIHGSDCNPESYGRLGTIDPGDLVFVRKTGDVDDIRTQAMGGGATYGAPGDVVVYRPAGNTKVTPIIHRALFAVQVHEDGTFSVPELGISRDNDLDQPRLVQLTGCALTPRSHTAQWGPADSGIITRGDNNALADQCPGGGISPVPARAGDILGKARGELPWIGLVNLLFGDITGGSSNFARSGDDSKVMFFGLAALVIVGPWALDRFLRHRREKVS